MNKLATHYTSEQTANDRMELLTKQMAKSEGVTDVFVKRKTSQPL